MVSSYRSLLAVGEVRGLLVSSVIARMPLGMSSLAILLFARAASGSFVVAGLAVGAFTLASAAVAPLQGALVDRFGQARVLLPCAAGQGVLLAALVAVAGVDSGWLLVTIAGMAGALTPPVSACVRVLWPQVSGDTGKREAAYALDAITQEIIWITGPLLVAVIVRLSSPASAVLVAGAITVLGSILFLRSSLARGWRGSCWRRRRRVSALSSRGLRALLGSVALMGVTIGSLEVGLPALAAHLGARSDAGVLLALCSFGSMAGGVLYGIRKWRVSMGTRHTLLLAAVAVLVAPLLLAHTLLGGMFFSLLAGIGLAPIFSCQYMLVGALAPDGAMAEAFTWQTAALVLGIATGSALAGVLVDAGGSGAPFVFGSCGAVLAFLLAAFERRRIEPLAHLAAA
ncbi:MAG TPA: MFS transporter [Solirubrobacteraceae bacterium]|jgi:MFS family permease